MSGSVVRSAEQVNTAGTGRAGRSAGALAILVALAVSLPARGAVTVAILDYQDQFSNTKGLGQLLTDIGQSYTDKTAQVQSGQAINLAGFDTFIVGSFCTQQSTIKSALASAATTLNQFVNNGGTVIMLTQADQTVAQESWVPLPARVVRGDPDFDLVYRVQTGHQLFSTPNVISDSNLQGWRYTGSATWSTSWESIVTFEQVGVLAGDGATDVSLASIVEAGWGTGRALFLSLAPDKARNIGNTQAKLQAPRLMRNMLKYAEDVKAGTVPPIVIYRGGGWSGPITGTVFNDADGDGVKDEGEAGIAGVGVSDTIDLVVTAGDGTYTLPNAAGDARLIYISLPSGYAKTNTWYKRISGSSAPADFSFALASAEESRPFDFAQISDIHIGGNGTTALLTSALGEVAALKSPPKFILATGDLADSGSNLSHFDGYVAGVNSSAVPVFSVFGNHDANSGGASNYRKYLGPDYYSFDYADCHFLILNAIQKTTQQQAWVAKDLQLLRGSKRLFIFQHYSPSQEEHTQFQSWSAEAVFSGHWHSQHTVSVGSMTSYNTATFLFGGIDCSPAGFKVISVTTDRSTSRMRWIADGKQLQIVTPSNSVLVPNDDVLVIVNAYETSADVESVGYRVEHSGEVVAEGSLTRQGQWSWRTMLPAAQIPRGAYDLHVTATNDRGETSTAQTTFTVLGLRKPRTAPDGEWTQFGGGPARGGVAAGALEPPLGPVWAADTEGTIDFGSPVVKDKTVYVGVKDRGDLEKNGVLALKAEDGSRVWFTPTPAAVSHSVTLDQDRVYACSHGGVVHALNRTTGAPIWSSELGSPYQRFQYSGPLLLNGALFAGTYAYFASFNPATGSKNWPQSYGADWISSNACPSGTGNIVVVPANWANNVRAVNAATGATIWQYSVQGLHGSPVIVGNDVLFTDYSGTLHCAVLANGSSRWTRPLGGGRSASTPAVANGIVVAGGTGYIRGFRLDTGAQIWEKQLATSALKMAPYNNTFAALAGSPTIADRIAYVPCGDGRLYALNLDSGAEVWSMRFGTPLLSAPCIIGNVMYLTAFDGNVYALASRSAFAIPTDVDKDGDVDQTDFGYVQICLTPNGNIEVLPGCEPVNFNLDPLVDQADVEMLLDCLSGANRDIDTNCLN